VYCRLALAVACLFTLACIQKPVSLRPERLAVLRFENLGSNPSDDWMGRALPEVITAELTGVPGIYAIPASRLHSLDRAVGTRPAGVPGISAERSQALLAGANRIGYGEYAVLPGRLEVRLTIEDPGAGRAVRVISTSAAAGRVLEAASDVARALSARAVRYGTRNEQVLREYVTALEAGSKAVRDQALASAISGDPDFAPAVRLLAQAKAQEQDREGALTLLRSTLARGTAIPATDRASLELEAAVLRDDVAASQKALEAVVRVTPGDPVAWRALGESAMRRRLYGEAAVAFRKMLELEPEDASGWNQLGYAAGYAGDLDGAVTALRRYQALLPAQANPLDSLGDVNLISGRLREAEGFYVQAVQKDPNFARGADYFKAAVARLMTGDVAGADALAEKFADLRAKANDPELESHRAGWLWLSGRRSAAYQRLASFARSAEAGSQREVASRAYAELSIWSLLLEDRSAAARMEEKAAALVGPSSASTVLMTRFLIEPPASASEWENRVSRLFPPNLPAPVKDLALGCALLLGREYHAATPPLRRVYDASGASDVEGVPILLAWSLLEAGDLNSAAPLLRQNPIPPITGPAMFTWFYFPRLYYLRGIEAEKLGKAEEARANYKLFQVLSGSQQTVKGGEKSAQE